MKNTALFFICFLLLVSCNGGNIKSGAAKRDRAEGMGTVFDGDTAAATDRAITDAQNNLIEKVMGALVSSNSVMENYRLASSVIEKDVKASLIKDQTIISRDCGADVCKVVIEGTVVQGPLVDAAKNALDRYGNPKFLVLMEEQYFVQDLRGGKRLTQTLSAGKTKAEAQIEMLMQEANIQFINKDTVDKLMQTNRREMMSAANGQISSDVQKLFLGNEYGADIVIFGKVILTDQTAQSRALEQKMGIKSNQFSVVATLTLKAVDIYTGITLSTATTPVADAYRHTSMDNACGGAIRNSVESEMILGGIDENTKKYKPGRFFEKIISAFTEAAMKRQINLTVRGLDQNEFRKFCAFIGERIRGVKETKVKGRTGSAALLEVYFNGKPDAFFQELLKKSQSSSYQVTITQQFVTRANLDVKKVAKK